MPSVNWAAMYLHFVLLLRINQIQKEEYEFSLNRHVYPPSNLGGLNVKM